MPTRAEPSAQHLARYRAMLQEAADGGGALMRQMIAVAQLTLQTSAAAARDPSLCDALTESTRQLGEIESDLCSAYPTALLVAFTSPGIASQASALAPLDLHFDQLELMDEGEVTTSVLIARTQQEVMLAAQTGLAELNALMSSTFGLGSLQPETNPLRPGVYLNALKAVIEQTARPGSMQQRWLGAMGVTLGQELPALYVRWSNRLKAPGIIASAVGRAISPDADKLGGIRAALAPAPEAEESLLTLEKLRRLLLGELQPQTPANRVQDFAQQFSREFEDEPAPSTEAEPDFAATVPAAFEALTEMKQVQQVLQTLERRRGRPAAEIVSVDSPVGALRQALQRNASGVAQALSLEVVSLMLDNLAHDQRLLAPVQRLLAALEPALLRLVLVDPRFFTYKQHPARALLQEIADASLAYASEQAPGFAEFMRLVEPAGAALTRAVIENDEPFAQVLQQLRAAWAQAEGPKERERQDAVAVLRHAEARNLLAERIALEIEVNPHTARVAPVVADFLCGPWSQVLAQARITDGAGSALAEKYQTLVSALLWSVHPDLAGQNTAKLNRLIPLLLGTLREGLGSIGYPASQTSGFFKALMDLHQLAFRSARKTSPAAPAPVAPDTRPASQRPESAEPWVAPEEARASGLMQLPDLAESPELAVSDLPVGAWVELKVDEQWVRTQLTWASPHGSLFLFTSVQGTTQSMTRRSRDKLVASGKLRLLSGRPLVEQALDAVAQIAMKNSVDSTF